MVEGPPSERIRKIVHIDMDAFFAAVEQRDNPALRGRPVAVGGSSLRGVVAAASYEARAFGVHSAMPSVTAVRKCPELIFVKSRFDVYKQVSGQIHDIFLRYTPVVEPLSLDEAYLDLTDHLADGELATDAARAIRRDILAATGLTASAGISYNKFLAKIASGHRKPDGQFAIPPEKGEAFVRDLAIGKFHGVGPATARRMENLGVRNGGDLREKTLPFLETHFGKFGQYLFNVARGIDHRSVRADRIRKSVGAERTFDQDVHDFETASEKLVPIVDKVVHVTTGKALQGRTLTVKIKYSDFEITSRRITAVQPISGRDEILRRACDLLRPLFPPDRGVRLLGISLSNFTAATAKPSSQMRLDI